MNLLPGRDEYFVMADARFTVVGKQVDFHAVRFVGRVVDIDGEEVVPAPVLRFRPEIIEVRRGVAVVVDVFLRKSQVQAAFGVECGAGIVRLVFGPRLALPAGKVRRLDEVEQGEAVLRFGALRAERQPGGQQDRHYFQQGHED